MKTIIRKIIIWVLGGTPALRGDAPDYDPAMLDQLIAAQKQSK